MAHVAHADTSIEFEFDGLADKLKSFGKTLFWKLVESRMETARIRLVLAKI